MKFREDGKPYKFEKTIYVDGETGEIIDLNPDTTYKRKETTKIWKEEYNLIRVYSIVEVKIIGEQLKLNIK